MIICILLIGCIFFNILILDYSPNELFFLRDFLGIIGLFFLIVMPGFLIGYYILRITTDFINLLLYSIGLSLSFLVLTGFNINVLRFFELSEINVIIFIFFELLQFLILLILFSLNHRSIPKQYCKIILHSINSSNKKITISSLTVLIVLMGNFFSIILSKIYDFSYFYLFIILVNAFVILSLVICENKSDLFYLIIIFIISLSLLYQVTIYQLEDISKIGVFELPLWNFLESGNYNTTFDHFFFLPFFTMVFGRMGIVSLLYPILFSLIPIVAYQLFRMFFEKKIALVSAFLIIINPAYFMVMYTSPRDQLAQLFFVISILVIFDKEISITNKKILSGMFLISIIPMAYGYATLSLIYLLFGVLTSYLLIVGTQIYYREFKNNLKKTIYFAKNNEILKILKFNLLVFASTFFLYFYYTTNSSLFRTLSVIFKNFIFNVGSTELYEVGSAVSSLELGNVSTLGSFFRFLQIFIQISIVMGILILLGRGKNYPIELTSLALGGLVILFLSIVIPKFAVLGYGRLYNYCLFLLAIPCVLGGIKIFSLISKMINFIEIKRDNHYFKQIVTPLFLFSAFIIFPYFLFSTGFIYEITNQETTSSIDIPWSFILSGNRIDIIGSMKSDSDILASSWLKNFHMKSKIYGDSITLLFFSNINTLKKERADQSYSYDNVSNNYIFLREWNNRKGEMGYQTMKWSAGVQHSRVENHSSMIKKIMVSHKIYNSKCVIIYSDF